ncbi:uncharacterized protein LOC111367926 isoform X2 [Olea europaea var. sylvestris]|uniref:uncharacterized protein LOC111367926 isoform X2 n=1 Tax=Olea europaea var. sylvestris TaxID=158386 RepID=UPI000C1D39B2|nr:uncharacterized protein LOC111367926 isoform X2 [Olea europaea var. sylvestris]
MDMCRLPMQLPAINLRYEHTSPFRPLLVRCNMSQNAESMESANGQMFVLGMGFVGQFFAADLKSKGWVVSGSCTSVEKKTKLEEMGFPAYVFDANEPQPEILDIMKNHTHLLVSIPPVKGLGDPMLRHKELVKRRLKDGKIQWLTYLSSTSVYGDCGGAWVDEDYPIRPTSEPARSRLAAEEEWLCLGCDLGIAAQIFRLGGIYGPGRRQVYNIVDDDPAPRMEVFMWAQNLVEQKFPCHVKQPTISPEREESLILDKVSRGYKRVSNARMKKELGVKLFHSNYRSGLQSIIDHMDNPYLQNSPGS